MLSLKDIYRHYGMRKTHEALVRISDRQPLTNGYLPIVEDLVYIGHVRRSTDASFDLTDAGVDALQSLDAQAGHLLRQHEPSSATA